MNPSPCQVVAITKAWLRRFETSLRDGDAQAVAALFLADGWWRDQLVSRWDLQTVHGRADIEALITATRSRFASISFTVDPSYEPTLVGTGEGSWVQAILTFEHRLGSGSAVVRLKPDADGWKAWTFFARLETLRGHEPMSGERRPRGVTHGAERAQVTWLDRRAEAIEYADREPTVVVIGAGQSGLALAAELTSMGVDTLVLERHARVGDNWRSRYRSLVLHDPVHSNHLPFLPFPSTWPMFTPKDKFGDWLEAYASVLDLNVWSSTTFEGASYDDEAGRWDLTVHRNGVLRTLHPTHVVLATGVSGRPKTPNIDGADVFEGITLHSSEFSDAADYAGKHVIIIGASNSAHDIAHDLAENGVEVTMVQRSSTQVASSKNMFDVLFPGMYGEGENLRHGDLLSGSWPLPVLFALHREQAFPEIQRRDAAMIAGLTKAGFRFNPTGIQELFYRRGGGYYIDVGAAAAIIDGRIRVKSGVEVSAFTPTGVTYSDGTEEPADVVIFATGYGSVRAAIGERFGSDVEDRVSEVWGVGDDDEMRGVWRPTGHPGLWVMGGNLFLVRQHARVLALQLVAHDAGMIEDAPPMVSAVRPHTVEHAE